MLSPRRIPVPTSHQTDFLPTRWSLVVAAAAHPHPDSRARQALAELAQAYWYPLYAYIRRQGHTPADSEDLTQAFFAEFIEKHVLTSADPAKGRFRAFLLACLNHFLSHQRDKARAQKRGGGRRLLSLEAAESRYAREGALADSLSPERLYERRWALAVLERVLAHLEADYRETGQSALFAALKPTLTASAAPHHAEIAAQLAMTPAAVKVAAHRLRRRYRAILQDEISQTVATPEEVAEEIAYLLQCL
jgi:RNA polymerase sigma factor (sigma-70 family)